MSNIPLVEGMMLRIIKGDEQDLRPRDWHLYINWIAGRVPIGAIGVVSKEKSRRIGARLNYKIDFEGHPVEIDGCSRTLAGPNVSDQFEVVYNPTQEIENV